ncbi:MAG: DUF7009 family protein [Woeseiaceae bacterium]
MDEVLLTRNQNAKPGIRHVLRDSGTLSLLIEKDFSCLAPGHHRPDEDDADTYTHPERAKINRAVRCQPPEDSSPQPSGFLEHTRCRHLPVY